MLGSYLKRIQKEDMHVFSTHTHWIFTQTIVYAMKTHSCTYDTPNNTSENLLYSKLIYSMYSIKSHTIKSARYMKHIVQYNMT